MTRKHATDYDARWWKVIDLETGQPINNVSWANDETGEYQIVHPGNKEQRYTEHLGRIRLVNTLWEAPLAIAANGDTDLPFGVYTVTPDGIHADRVMSFPDHENAQGYIDWIRKQAADVERNRDYDHEAFLLWYNAELPVFHSAQYNEEQIAYAAWLAGRRYTPGHADGL